MTQQKKELHQFLTIGRFTIHFNGNKAYLAILDSGFKVDKKTPNHKHDCSNCMFLYSEDNTDIVYDIYFCTQGNTFPTVIARYGDNGSDYYSGLGMRNPILSRAEKFCREIGLLQEENKK